MAATPSIKIMKLIPWRGGTRLVSNRFHFNGGTPADGAHWTTFADAVTAAEKALYGSDVTIVEAVGYAAGSDVPIFSKTYGLTGTLAITGSESLPGEVVGLIRWATTARTTKNHPVYLFSYVHGARKTQAGVGDSQFPAQRTALATYATAWVSGFSDGTNTLVRAGPNGATAVSGLADGFLTHRDFPRG